MENLLAYVLVFVVTLYCAVLCCYHYYYLLSKSNFGRGGQFDGRAV